MGMVERLGVCARFSASLTVTPDNLSCRALSLVQTKKVLGDFKVDN